MQFHDKTAYVWGLRYRWDPSLSMNPVRRFAHFIPPCSMLIILDFFIWWSSLRPCQWQGTCFYWKLYHLHHYFGRSSISLKANIGAKSSGVRAFTSHVWGLVLYVTAQSVPHLSVQGPTLQMKYLDSLELLYRGLESLQELFCWMRETMTQCPPIFEAETMFQYVELTTNSSPEPQSPSNARGL